MKYLLYRLLQRHKWHKDWLGCWKCEFKMHYESSQQKVQDFYTEKIE